jgi:hypothetical protein
MRDGSSAATPRVRAFLEQLPVSAADKERIVHGNAEKLFGCSPDGAQRNPGRTARRNCCIPDYAPLHPGYAFCIVDAILRVGF